MVFTVKKNVQQIVAWSINIQLGKVDKRGWDICMIFHLFLLCFIIHSYVHALIWCLAWSEYGWMGEVGEMNGRDVNEWESQGWREH